jgi:Ca-activated chloride channel family protein
VKLLAANRLWLLAGVVALLLAYVAMQVWGRRRYAVRFTNLALLGSVAPKRPGWRRHVPAGLLLLALTAMITSLARPARAENVPRERATIVMAIDVSISMDATDVAPSRLEAARAAAKTFAESLPEPINLGLVAFARTARVVVAPTTDHDSVVRAIDALELAEATAIGEAILASLDAIRTQPITSEEPTPAHVVLMSDGETTAGTPADVAADEAVDAGIPVSTIAFGTPTGTIEYRGELLNVGVDVDELAGIAERTNGTFYEAATASELEQVYESIGSSMAVTSEDREIGVWFVGAAAAVCALSMLASLVFTSKFP